MKCSKTTGACQEHNMNSNANTYKEVHEFTVISRNRGMEKGEGKGWVGE